jgi:hypothetical protein
MDKLQKSDEINFIMEEGMLDMDFSRQTRWTG